MLRLQCVAQNYDWGRLGLESAVAQLYSQGSGAAVVESKPYAELWMGTHPSGPSVVALEGSNGTPLVAKPLQAWLQEHPEALGENVLSKWGGELPFLFKVLSVAKALSIQAHPDKKLAERLHAERPDVYKDDNHKPEMALALTDFESLCGFVSTEELAACFKAVPELWELVGKEAGETFAAASDPRDGLKAAFQAVMTQDKGVVRTAVSKLTARLQAEGRSRTLSPKENLILRLEQQYPGDVGIFSAFFLNYITLAPGECIYLAANEPHAYLSGECVECMAASDNVVRAGLTPKLIDTEVLCAMLTYNQGKPETLRGETIDKCTKRYIPPFDEFEIDHITVPGGESYKVPVCAGPSIYIVQQGHGLGTQGSSDKRAAYGLKRGDTFFLPAHTPLELSCTLEADSGAPSSLEPLQVFRAGCNDRVL